MTMKNCPINITQNDMDLVKSIIPMMEGANIKSVVSLAINKLYEEICLDGGRDYKNTLLFELQEIKSMLSEALDDDI